MKGLLKITGDRRGHYTVTLDGEPLAGVRAVHCVAGAPPIVEIIPERVEIEVSDPDGTEITHPPTG